MLKVNYTMEESPPVCMEWEEYEKRILKEYYQLLQEKPEDEKTFQNFFESNPSFLPGPFGLLGESGHSPYRASVISQPKLIGLSNKIPDFMWIASDSSTIYPVLIEIEAPSKKMFIASGKPSEKFNQAIDQLTDWRVWFSNPKNLLLFFDYYSIPSSFYEGKAVVPLFVLIYGRRDEFNQKPELNIKRNQLQRNDEFHMTYDRLMPSYKASPLLCTKVKDGKYYAVKVPPVIKLGPNLSRERALILGKEEAVKNNKLITKERKEFLIKRIPYWDKFGSETKQGLIRTGDLE